VINKIYKNKGSKLDPKNYRPITPLSCIRKISTSLLDDRLNVYFEQFTIVNENQAGFKHGYSTTDHMFSVYALFELLCVKKKNFTVLLSISKRRLILFKKIHYLSNL